MEQFLVFFAGIFVYLFVFTAFQLVVFRMHRVRELILVFSLLAFAAAFAVWVPFYFFTEHLYPDPMMRALVAFSGAYGTLGLAGIYIILGPISSDRSLSAHMHIMMMRNGGSMTREEILARYTKYVVFDKRFDEYLYVGVMTESDGRLHLTAKGRRVAHIFGFFLKALKMKENF